MAQVVKTVMKMAFSRANVNHLLRARSVLSNPDLSLEMGGCGKNSPEAIVCRTTVEASLCVALHEALPELS